MSFAQFLLVLKARWLLVLALMLGIVAVVSAWSLLLPAQYTATVSVLVDGKTGSIDPIAGVVMPTSMASVFVATQADVIASERVVKRALRLVKATDSPALKERWAQATNREGDFESWLAGAVSTKLEVRPSRESNVINVSFSGPDRHFVAAMANAIVRAYIDTTLELRTEPARQYNSFFDERAKQARDALEKAQARLSAYQQQSGITSTDERLDIENSKLSELSTQWVALQAVATESTTRHQAASAKGGDRVTEALNNPVIVGVTTELAREEAKLDEMSERFGDQHPQVQELRANIRQLKSRIDTETHKVSASLGINSEVNQIRLAEVRAALAEQRAKVLRLKGQRDDVSVLQREVENAQRSYDSVLGRVNQTSLESQNNQTNVSVVKEATPPPFPSGPRVGLNIMMAIVIGTLLGMGMVLSMEVITPHLRSEEDITQRLKRPLLVILPAANTQHASKRAQSFVKPADISPWRLLR
jgi:succinoglycan biosynthesis transport protein ExoP